MAENPPAWHPDPTGKHDHRWWDGQRWTEHVADAGVAAIDPLPAAPGAGTQQGATDASGQAADGGSAAWAAGGGGSDGGEAAGGSAGAGADAGRSGGEAAGEQAPWPGSDAGTSGTGAAGAAPAAGTQAAWGGDPASGEAGGQPAWGGGAQTWGADGGQASGQQSWGAQSQAPGQQPAWGGGDGGAWSQGGEAAWGGAPPAGDPTKTPGMAIAALVLGILAIPSAIILIGGLFGLIAIILGAIAAGKAKRGEVGGRGVAIGGIVTGVVGLIIAIVIFVSVMIPIFQATTECLEQGGTPEQCQDEIERDLFQQFG